MRTLVALLLAIALACPTFGSPVVNLKGKVTDLEGAVIRGAHVILHWDKSGAANLKDNVGIRKDRTVETDKSGEFALDLPSGFYDVLVSAPGFAPIARKIRIKRGQNFVFIGKLKPDPLVTRELGDRFSSK